MTSSTEEDSGDVAGVEHADAFAADGRSVERALARLERLDSELKSDYMHLQEELHLVKEKQRVASRHWKQVRTTI